MSDAPPTPDNRELHWRVGDLERRVDERLRGGAQTFAELKAAIEAVRDEAQQGVEALRPKPMPAWKLVASCAGMIVFVATLIWQAARYPTREEYNQSQATTRENIDEVRLDVGAIKLEQVQIKGSVEHVRDALTRVERSQEAITEQLARALKTRGAK